MDKDTQNFTPELVDGQVDRLLASRSLPSQEKRVVADLQQMFQDDERSLKSVWQRLGLESDLETSAKRLSRTLHAAGGKSSSSPKVLAFEKDRPMSQFRKSPIMRTLSLVAAACVAILIVGSMLIVTNLAHQSKKSTGVAGTHAQAAITLPPGIYISSQRDLFRLNAQSHQIAWQSAQPAISKIIPTSKTVYILESSITSTGDNGASAVVALDANSGKVLWTYVFKQPADGNAVNNTTSMVLFQNNLYVGLSLDSLGTSPAPSTPIPTKGEVDVLSATNGKLQTVYPAPTGVDDLAVSSDGLLAVSSDTSLQVYRLASASKTPLWQSATPNLTMVRSLSFVAGRLYEITLPDPALANRNQSFIMSYQAESGTQVWKSPVFSGTIEGYTIDQHVVYFGTLVGSSSLQDQSWTGSVYAYDTQANKQLWSQAVPGGVQVAPIVSNGLVYVTAGYSEPDWRHSYVVALTTTNGTLKWQQQLSNNLTDSLCLSNGVLYAANNAASSFTSTPNGLYALDATGGNVRWENTQLGSPTNVVPTV